MMRSISLPGSLLAALIVSCIAAGAQTPAAGAAMPRIEPPPAGVADGHYAMMVDGKPYLMLGAQINNSSSWASTLPQAWPALEALHVNTVEAPVYWEQMEPHESSFDFSTVDLLVQGAREHHLHLVLLWFGTWKNGQNHYVPEWMKTNTKKYPRELTAYGKLLDVMSPNSPANLAADQVAFAALMRHLREVDGTQHTVIMIQVENESGSVGAVRDFSPMATKQFGGEVPAALHRGHGTWSQVYGADADERFAAYSTANYIGKVAAAGKAEYPLPMYCNVWITYPVHALENRDHASAGQEYPSGGPQQANIDIWKAAAPAIDILAPDFYSDDRNLYHSVIAAYGRADNALFIPEEHLAKDFGPNLFYALGHGAIGFSPFGIDYTGWSHFPGDKIPDYLASDFTLLLPMQGEIARLNHEGKLQTSVEQAGEPVQRIHFTGIDAVVGYGYPQHDGSVPPGTPDASGRALVAQLGPMEFLVTGVNASVTFQLTNAAGATPRNEQVEILRAEEGRYVDGSWQASRIWNGDQTDRGLNFHSDNSSTVIRIRLHTLPLTANLN